MHPTQSARLKKIIIIASLLGIGLLIWGLVWFFSFRLTSVDPEEKASTVATQITFRFNRELSEDTLKGINISPAANGASVIEGNTYIFRPSDDLQKGKLTFTFTDITAKDGSVIESLTKELSVGYVEYENLSEEEKQRQINQSSGGQDRFEILNGYLPHAAYNYTLDYIEPLPEDKKLTLIIDIYGKATNETQQEYIGRMEQAREDVLQYIEASRGKNSMNDFDIFYNDPYLSRYNTVQDANTSGGG